MKIVLTSTDNHEKALEMAKKLVKNKIAACVHITEITSVYEWKDQIEESKEYKLEIKTYHKDIISKIKEIHNYELPEIVVIEGKGSEEYERWVKSNSTGHK